MKLAVRVVVTLGALGLSASPLLAKKDKDQNQDQDKPAKAAPPACGLKTIPLAVGNVWTYKSGPGTVLVRVVDVKEGGDGTQITVEEKYQDRANQLVFTCDEKRGLVIPPDSFFFAGEPGGAVGAETKITKRDSVSLLPDKEMKSGSAWVEKLHADVLRADTSGQGAQHPSAKFEVERHVSVADSEVVELKLGRATAQKITFELRGRGVVDAEKSEIPIKRPGAFYVLKGLGILKIDDAFDRTWELVSTTVPFKKK